MEATVGFGFFAVILVALFGVIMGLTWGGWWGSCEECGSWNRWQGVDDSYDDHRGLMYHNHHIHCRSCGNDQFKKVSVSYK